MPRKTTLFLFACLLLAASAAGQEIPPDTLKAATPQVDDNLEKCRENLRNLDHAAAVLDSVLAAPSDDQALRRIAAVDQFERIQGLLTDLAGRVPKLLSAPEVVDSVRTATRGHLVKNLDLQYHTVDHLYGNVETMWTRRTDVPANELMDYESGLDAELRISHRALGWLFDTAALSEPLGHDAGALLEELDAAIAGHAETMAGRLRAALFERDRVDTQLKVAEAAGSGVEEISDLRLRLQAAEQRLGTNVEALRRTIRSLERRSLDASAYREVLVSATGEISEQLLDWDVIKGLSAKAWDSFKRWLRERGPTLLVRALILVAFVFLFRWTARLVWMLVLVTRVQRSSRLLRDMMGRMLMPSATVLGLFAGLWFLGANPTTLLAGVGVASVILGLALQDSLGNLAAGAFILLYRPYDVDDTVQAGGVVGLVKAMGLANTTIVTFDNRRLFVPNRKIWSEVIENRSMENRRRVETVVRVAFDEDVERVTEIIRQALADSEVVLDDPEPTIYVSRLAESWIEISVWPWASLENWWPLTIGLPRLMLDTLHAHGIRIPYERRDISLSGQMPGPEQKP